jgi:hypothetical protein
MAFTFKNAATAIKTAIKNTRALLKKPVVIAVYQSKSKPVKNVSTAEFGQLPLLKDQVVKTLVAEKKALVDFRKNWNDTIFELILEYFKQAAADNNIEITKIENGFEWFSLDGLQRVLYEKGSYAVANEKLGFAKTEFDKMIVTHKLDKEDLFVSLAIDAFTISPAGQMNTKSINLLRKKKCNYPEWEKIKEMLDFCYDYHDSKSYLRFYERASVQDNWVLITDN